jgi:UDPglucose--hexose-1-phosphate uridylyltransferase
MSVEAQGAEHLDGSTSGADNNETEFRLDLLTREWVAITGARQRRPNLPMNDCPFCVGGLEAAEPYVVKAFPNRWPALRPGEAIDFAQQGRELALGIPGRGVAEVVLYSADHDASLASLGREHLRRVIDLWAGRTQALLARPEIEYVLVFENRGAEVGATISHPHGQIYAFPFVPPVAAKEAAVAAEFGCPLCAEISKGLSDGSRLVIANYSFIAFTRFAAGWPFELLIAPREHLVDLSALDDQRRTDLADLLGETLARYDRLFDQPLPYMLWLHPGVHLHLHVVTPRRQANSMRFVAAGELGSGVLFNPVPPEDAAARLRAVGPVKPPRSRVLADSQEDSQPDGHLRTRADDPGI